MIKSKFYKKLLSSIILSLILFLLAIFSRFDVSIINKTVTTIILILTLIIIAVFMQIYNKTSVEDKKSKVLYTIIDYYGTILFAFCVISILNIFVIFPKVRGISMEPTLLNTDSVIVVRQSNIERFDVIVFYIDADKLNNVPEVEDGNLWCKRIIGLPGDRVTYVDGELYINDTYYEEQYIKEQPVYHPDTILPAEINNTEIPDGYYLVLGDNRSNSTDSRVIGLVSEDLIIGEIKYLISNGIKKVR